MVVTWYPDTAACRALMGSISVTITLAPMLCNAWAQPLPTSPKPATTATFPAIITSVARLIPSMRDSRHPYKLSNFDFVTESLTFTAGMRRLSPLSIRYRWWTPVVVSSETPWQPFSISGYFLWTKAVRSPPSSRIRFRCSPSLKATSCCSKHHSYSSSVSPFQANL